MPKRLERVRTGWVVHFRELALTRIPVKITTPSLLFESVKACWILLLIPALRYTKGEL